ncbi:MAG: DedA family protein [bacterium]|nr:DedA family protein [bacterium]
MLLNLINWVLNITQGLGYFGVGILMTIESSFLPFPSEIVIPPAAYLASQGKMNLILIIIAGVLGSLAGAVINYFLALSLGRLIVYKLAATRCARLILITPAKIERAEKYFLLNSKSATFCGRLIPVIRQLISIPAGFCRMPFWSFLFYTALGSFIWVSILAALGYFIGANQVLLQTYYREISWGLLTLGVVWVAWKFWKWRQNKNGAPSPSGL